VKILHVIPSLSIEDGGPSVAVERMANGLAALGVSVTILTTSSEGRNETVKLAFANSIQVVVVRRNLQPYKVSWPAVAWLRSEISNFDVVHIHAVFSFLSVVAGTMARNRGVPYIVRPLGVLNRWGMSSGRAVAKRVSYAVIESKVLRSASFIHYTSEREASETRELDAELGHVPSFILPVPVETGTEETSPAVFFDRFPELRERKLLLFLSRFGPQKGAELVIEAFAQLDAGFSQWNLVMAGGGEAAYEKRLKQMAEDLGLRGRIAWVGYLAGPEKWSAYVAADAYILPSYSESFGIAAAEALVAGMPALLSSRIPFAAEAASQGGARLVELTVDAVRKGLEELLPDSTARQSMGAAARRFARDRFTANGITAELLGLYQRISLNRRAGV
jgi:glycosyltransferase involved in cell wall biosynthesis